MGSRACEKDVMPLETSGSEGAPAGQALAAQEGLGSCSELCKNPQPHHPLICEGPPPFTFTLQKTLT